MTRFILALLLAAPLLTACASTPDPAKVCTAEWIAPRAERAAGRLEDKTAKAFRALRKVGAQWVAGDKPGTLSLLSLRGAVRDLEDELKDGRGVRDLRTLAQTCSDPELVRTEVTKVLERQDIPEPVLNFLRGSSLLDRLIALAEGTADDEDTAAR